MADNKTAPVALTTEQKLEIRNFQTKLSKIEIAKLQMQTQFEKAVADQRDLNEQLQKYFNDITVIADNDEAGSNMKTRLIEKLGPRVSVIQLDKKYKDIGDMDDESIKNLQFQFDKSIASMLN